MKNKKVSAVICAAGKGERASLNKNKLLAPLYGAPVLWHTLKKFDMDEIDEVIVTSSKFDLEEISAICAPFSCKIVLGGATRTESVKKALEAVTGDIVLIHDGARPFVSKQLILNCIKTVITHGSAICAVRATDTVVYGHYGTVCERLDRESLYLLQTPQGFLTDDIHIAYNQINGEAFTDDSAIYGKFINKPHLIDGERTNVKLTYKEDFGRVFPYSRFLPDGCRTGFGVDVHAFGKGEFVTLCGEKIACGKRLIAHSDGDVAVHALMDALLSAAGLKDIGHYFPDTDEEYRNADSVKLLEKTVKIINTAGFVIENISLSIQAEKPRLAPYIENMKMNLQKATGTAPENIAVAAGTCEGLGFVGEGLGICAYCTVLLKEVKEFTNGKD
ncbi:MAG: 2-C-methyl-D-erythritol 2,4-cyclodiphosphate synthase [Clostridia bacterium]|nr:2-C-methyl-D-erythritol 2,4-cyclodiphosphate synthase [Clostridia bacterium]